MIFHHAQPSAFRSSITAFSIVTALVLLLLPPFAFGQEGDDDDPPIRRNGRPMGTLAAGTGTVTLSLETGTAATCRYSLGTTRVEYDAMPSVFTVTGATVHSTTVTGLINGESYNYYVRCRDREGKTNAMDFDISFSIAADGPGDGKTDKILFIGNSYTGHNGGIHNHLHRLMAAAGKMAEVAGEIHGGEAFSYKNRRYRGFLKRRRVRNRISSEPWDAVVLQSYYEPESDYLEAGAKLIELVRKNGSAPVLFMIWGHELHPDQDRIFRQRTERLGKRKKAQVAPIGMGIRRAREEGIEVYADGSHLSLEGAYLAAAMFYAFFTGESPRGLSYTGYNERQKLSPDTAHRLQRLAWRIISDYGVFFDGRGNMKK